MATTHLGFCIKCNSSYIGWEHQCSFPSQPNSKGRHWCSNDCFKCGNFTPEDAIKVSIPGEVNKCEKCHGLKIPNDGKFLCNCPCHSKDSIQGEDTSDEWTNEILTILAHQQTITNQGINYTGEKDWALNKIKSLLTKTRQETLQKLRDVVEGDDDATDILEEIISEAGLSV